jgi:hypothetical protein
MHPILSLKLGVTIQKESDIALWLLSERERLWEGIFNSFCHPILRSKECCVSSVGVTGCKTLKIIKEFHDVFPPKGTNWASSMWWSLGVGDYRICLSAS